MSSTAVADDFPGSKTYNKEIVDLLDSLYPHMSERFGDHNLGMRAGPEARDLAQSRSWMNTWLKAGRVPPGYNVDHIIPLSIGGADNAGNMRLLLMEDHWLWHRFYHPWR